MESNIYQEIQQLQDSGTISKDVRDNLIKKLREFKNNLYAVWQLEEPKEIKILPPVIETVFVNPIEGNLQVNEDATITNAIKTTRSLRSAAHKLGISERTLFRKLKENPKLRDNTI